MFILDKLRNFKKSLSPHRPLIEIFVYKDNLLYNLHAYQRAYPALQFAPVLKANAYGHGLEQVLSVLRAEVLPFVCVDSHFEFRIAQKYAPTLPVLVIGFSRFESIAKSRFPKVSFTIVSFEQLEEISAKLKTPKSFHLKLDTGMHRQGITADQYLSASKLILANSNILLEGLCSHLADSENETESLKQIESWNSAVKYFRKQFPNIKHKHLTATGGVKFSQKIDANLVRLGIGFYGIDPSFNTQLKPALEMRSIITGIKTIDAGEKIGYDLTFQAKNKMTVATVPVGYFEGVDRRLSNKGFFKLGENFCPLVGRLSMDIATIDITEIPGTLYGSEVAVISRQARDKNSVENMAKICSTIPYESLVHIPQHLKRAII